jgi:hypothetical protein
MALLPPNYHCSLHSGFRVSSHPATLFPAACFPGSFVPHPNARPAHHK